MDQVKFVKGCLSQILLDPFLNTLSHMALRWLFYDETTRYKYTQIKTA